MRECPECRSAVEDGARSCPSCGTAAVAAKAPPARSRKAFWAFAAVILVAVAGGGGIAALGRRNVAARRGHPDTIAPGSVPASNPASTPASTQGETGPPRSAARAPPDREKALALCRRAEALCTGRDIDRAIDLYLAAEAADPGLAEVQEKLARCYQLKGDTRRAAERYRRYLATDPDDAERVRAVLSTLR